MVNLKIMLVKLKAPCNHEGEQALHSDLFKGMWNIKPSFKR